MPRFDDSDFGISEPLKSPTVPRDSFLGGTAESLGSNNSLRRSHGNLAIPHRESVTGNSIEVPASRSPLGDAAHTMHSLSIDNPRFRDRHGSRNSFGRSLPIPSKRPSRLSQVPPAARREILAAHVQDVAGEKTKTAKNMAFVFDIDGVLVHGDQPIEEGRRALEILNGDNELGIKIPHIFLTNGGGKPEEARCQQLTDLLKSPVSVDQFIQSHTPMQALAEYYNTVLVVGGVGQKCREVAQMYGFKDVVMPYDILAWDPTITPYIQLTPEQIAEARPRDFSKVNIEAILVFSDSRDWSTDMQIMLDLLRSENGRMTTVAKDPESQRIPIYFSQGDLWYPTEHKISPRLTQGNFRVAFEALYKVATGVELERVVYGKPELATYKYADEVMTSWMEQIHNEEKLPQNIYMVGDNPQSDIVGGNMYGWNTCLVRTGVFKGGDNDETNPANFGVFPNVLEAVKTAIRKEIGKEFNFEWNEKFNPLLDRKESSAIEV